MNESNAPVPINATANQPSDDAEQPLDVDAERARILSEAYFLAEKGAAEPKLAFSKARRHKFIDALVVGATISEAAHRVGISPTYIHSLRRSDPDFAEAVATAREIGADRVLGRVQAIALTGAPDRMATIKAQELYLKGAHPEYRDNRGSSATIERVHPDGTRDRISARTNGIPD